VDPQEARWIAQLSPLPGASVISPSFGYPTDSFLWNRIHFGRVYSFTPMASDEAKIRVREIITSIQATDPFLQAYAAYWDVVLQAWGAPPGYGAILLPTILSEAISADDGRRFMQFGGFPKTVPVPGSSEFRIEVEAVKSRWASCDITNPNDPYRVLTEVVATARAEWEAEVGGQASARNAIVAAHVQTWEQMRLANEALIESLGQAWVPSGRWRGSETRPRQVAR
jgi:hypothetical protein